MRQTTLKTDGASLTPGGKPILRDVRLEVA